MRTSFYFFNYRFPCLVFVLSQRVQNKASSNKFYISKINHWVKKNIKSVFKCLKTLKKLSFSFFLISFFFFLLGGAQNKIPPQ